MTANFASRTAAYGLHIEPNTRLLLQNYPALQNYIESKPGDITVRQRVVVVVRLAGSAGTSFQAADVTGLGPD